MARAVGAAEWTERDQGHSEASVSPPLDWSGVDGSGVAQRPSWPDDPPLKDEA